MEYQAKVKETSMLKTVRFSGIHEFVRYEWRYLPEEKIELARNNPHLKIRELVLPETETADEFLEKGSAEALLELDDLTAIKGVGKATASILALYGYSTFASIANEDPEKMRSVLSNEDGLKRLSIDSLIEQAKELQ